ncbi:DUF1697 domain-containing protein [Propionicicella superfundia]|uniref:DUF1697 domain-containing protein n=1 Tax=Propionicicella superfundia TaxID=348582 RepID=UPI0004272C25|nr:DUF1697 domain-containing protein [Propionicicella superfundia]
MSESGSRHVALLRGVNVGTGHRVPMERLREVTAATGATGVRTHLNSGNVLLTSGLPAAELEATLTVRYAEEFGFAVPTIVLTATELLAIAAANPYPDADPARVGVCFVRGVPADGLGARIERLAAPSERWTIGDGAVHVDFAAGMGRSALAAGLAGVFAPATVTVRNARTVAALAGLVTGV